MLVTHRFQAGPILRNELMNNPVLAWPAMLPRTDIYVPAFARIILDTVVIADDEVFVVSISCQAYLARLNSQVRVN
jgi:hypothetical protein